MSNDSRASTNWILKSCPRCKGDVKCVTTKLTKEFSCIQCGWERIIDTTSMDKIKEEIDVVSTT